MLHGDMRPVRRLPHSQAGALKRVQTVEQSDAGLVYTQELASRINLFLKARYSLFTTQYQWSWNDHPCNILPPAAILV